MIWGKSGSGKTSFLRSLAGLNPRVQGEIKFGKTVWLNDSVNLSAATRRCGYVFQDGSLFDHLTVRQNLNLARKYASCPRADYEHLLAAFGIDKLIDKRPCELSGGQCQRVALMRAVMISPKVILMDEPLSSLDRAARRELLGVLKGLDKFSTPVIYVTHDREELLTLADYVFVLDEGRRVFSGDLPEALDFLQTRDELTEDPVTVLELTVLGYDSDSRLTRLAFADTVFYVPSNLSSPVNTRMRIVIYGSDIILFPEVPPPMSALNVAVGKIVAIGRIGHSRYLVQVDTAEGPVRTLITEKSLNSLRLRLGVEVWLGVKAVSLIA